ncbi:DJ-1/PfpI family protein [Bacillus albus]|uniref:DJ-1/PfpI family protein n=1 Tax=Bacillus TaxID=1386 RepID=UPI000BF2A230|nr:DJ-1/PfpI family protein [Bacillus albus]MBF7153626.1 DJ-1/PfpI family protein [Bacillus albus]PFB77312.1 4-methyl-5(B-hydroxyethyl)-thiazole monophosphate biosynthesis protein [Bacillus anthracis]PFM48250.1 4-methyl-5(B-hydroxyethyl)-thiazole monophosphate biosynthesis protein [Bacillus cereus]PGS30050.1 4-methyl-5(B-hydroxyethyl)-thiazole monophosphate biosynthesis protein [Bacillus cereus]
MKNKFEIITASVTKELIISETGLQVQSHIELSEVRVEEYEGIIIPGGDAIQMKEAEGLFSVICQFHEQEKLVAAICAGPYAIAKAGLFRAISYTVTMDYRKLDCFPVENFVYEEVVQHSNIITAQGHAFVPFGIAIASYFGVTNEHNINFYSGKGNVMMEELLPENV